MLSSCPLVGDPPLTSPAAFDVLVIAQGSAELVRGPDRQGSSSPRRQGASGTHCQIWPPATVSASCWDLAAQGSTLFHVGSNRAVVVTSVMNSRAK